MVVQKRACTYVKQAARSAVAPLSATGGLYGLNEEILQSRGTLMRLWVRPTFLLIRHQFLDVSCVHFVVSAHCLDCVLKVELVLKVEQFSKLFS